MLAKRSSNRLRTWIEIDRSAALRNYQIFRRRLRPQTKLWAVVKSNAYGHGLYAIPKLLARAGADGFCVDSLVEAVRLRENRIVAPILVLGPTLPNLLPQARQLDVAVTIPSFDSLAALTRMNLPPEFHLKFDTGMHRQGFSEEDAPKVIEALGKASPSCRRRFKGLYTHFATSGNPADVKYLARQNTAFDRIVALFNKNKFTPIVHCAATGATLLDRKYHRDAVRIGGGLYGLLPSPELVRAFGHIGLRPILSWKTIVTEIKQVAKGEPVGYDLTERVRRDAAVGILPVGYWHGLPRILSGTGVFAVNGRPAKVLGRISMDITTIDLTGTDAAVGDEVAIIGQSGKMNVSADDLALMSGTINYELVTRLNPLIERIST